MRRHLTIAGLLVAASGCARSAVVDELYDASEPDPTYESEAEEVEQPTASERPDDKTGDAEPADGPDKAADAGSKSDRSRDAGSPGDGGLGTPRDAGRVTAVPPPGLPVSRAGEAITDVVRDLRGRCNVATDCKTSCVPVGIVNCCRSDKTCGCTWAPGAYCL